jgi:hypothetical protein
MSGFNSQAAHPEEFYAPPDPEADGYYLTLELLEQARNGKNAGDVEIRVSDERIKELEKTARDLASSANETIGIN